MRQLIELLLQYRILLTFLGLELVSIFLVVQNNSFQRAIAFTTMQELTGGLYSVYTATTAYVALKEVNSKLAAENALLREQLVNQRIPIPLNVSPKVASQFEFITAKVINNSLIYSNNYITINKGSDDGIKVGMGVITTDGVVGKVKSCSPNFSILYSILHSDIMVSSTLKKSKTTCFTKWAMKAPDKAQVLYVPRHIPVQVGDTILTSGFNTTYPENYMVGTVLAVKKTIENTNLDITLKLSTNFSSLSYVYVLKNSKQPEIDSLQQSAEKLGNK